MCAIQNSHGASVLRAQVIFEAIGHHFDVVINAAAQKMPAAQNLTSAMIHCLVTTCSGDRKMSLTIPSSHLSFRSHNFACLRVLRYIYANEGNRLCNIADDLPVKPASNRHTNKHCFGLDWLHGGRCNC
jgi:hypothetical protein